MEFESSISWVDSGTGLLGPFGLLAGLMFGKSDKIIIFIVRIRDGHELLAFTKSEIYDKIL